MNCSFYREHELGRLPSERFVEHAKQCPECRQYVQQDKKLMEMVGTLDQRIDAPDLWDRIERSLSEEQKRRKTGRWRGIRQWGLLRGAAVFALVLGVGSYALWEAGMGPFHRPAPSPVSMNRMLTYQIVPSPQQRLYLDVDRIDITITGHAQSEIQVDATLTVKADDVESGDEWLEQADLVVRAYPDYVRVQLNTPPEQEKDREITAIRKMHIHVPAGQEIFVRNTDGMIRLEEVSGTVHAEGRNSPIEISRLSHFPEGGRIELLGGDRPVVVGLPADADAVITAATENGEIESDFPLYYFDADRRRASLYLGANHTVIDVQTTSGDIVILREERSRETY